MTRSVSSAIEHLQKECREFSTKPIYVGMSGGVDSSFCAVALKMAGFNVRGVFLNCWDEGEQCTTNNDYKDALMVASSFAIPLEYIDYRGEYKRLVVGQMLETYSSGGVPSPDIICNNSIKFGLLLGKVLEVGGVLATGHYAKRRDVSLLRGLFPTLSIPVDVSKDQTYFLSGLAGKEKLKSCIFPAGTFLKSEIRELALQMGIPVSNKPDSQGLCFVGKVNMTDFVGGYINLHPGNIIDAQGNIIGSHCGAETFAIGQRHGYDLKVYSADPLYVIKKDMKSFDITVGTRAQASFSTIYIEKSSYAGLFNASSIEDYDDYINEDRLKARVRNLGGFVTCSRLEITDSSMAIHLDDPVFGVTPGQTVVLYIDDYVVGSGIIKSN